MKKFIAAILISALLVMACTGCGQKAEPDFDGNAIVEYIQDGYTYNGISSESSGSGIVTTVMTIRFNSPDRTDFALVEATLSEEECAEWDALDFMSETYDEDLMSFLTKIPMESITVTSLNDQVLPQEELDSYIGKTLGELEADGYEWYTDDRDQDGTDIRVYCLYDTHQSIGITMEGGVPNLLELEADELAAIKITSVQFWGFVD